MATEYNKIILNIKRYPSPKNIMVAIPLYMYRIETNEFEHELNFFQKTVLKFKAKPGIKDDTIAQYIGLDSKLITIITSELQSKQLINEYGSLSEKGKEKLKEVDGLVVNSGKKKMGYVFKYVNQDKSYQYYVNNIISADYIEDVKSQFPKIITGTKGDGEDYTNTPFFLDELLKLKSNFQSPTERDVLQLIQNSNKKGSNQKLESSQTEKLSKQLSTRFINEQPELVWVCSYVYLYQNEDNTFDPEWRVLDPFGFGDNIALKFYLNNPINKNLLESINRKFADTKTLGGKILSDYQEQLSKLIEDKLLSDFSFGLSQLDQNLQEYIRLLVQSVITMEANSYQNQFASDTFGGYLQKILEAIILIDKEKNPEKYNEVYNRFDIDFITKKNGLIKIWRMYVFSKDITVPKQLSSVCNSSIKYPSALKGHLVGFLLTYLVNKDNSLFKVFNNRINEIVEITILRNADNHAQTSKEKILKSLSKEEVEKYYSFIKSFINDYIQNQ